MIQCQSLAIRYVHRRRCSFFFLNSLIYLKVQKLNILCHLTPTAMCSCTHIFRLAYSNTLSTMYLHDVILSLFKYEPNFLDFQTKLVFVFRRFEFSLSCGSHRFNESVNIVCMYFFVFHFYFGRKDETYKWKR